MMVSSRCGGSTAYAARPSADQVAPAPATAVVSLPTIDLAAFRSSAIAPSPTIAPTVAELIPADSDDVTAEPKAANNKPWIVRHWTLPVAVVMIVASFLTLRGHIPSLDSMAKAFSTADLRWLAAAVVLEAVSNGMFARQQRALLRSLGVRMSWARALGVTYARSALAISMPAGTAVSAGYAMREYKRTGASTEKATAVMVLSGIVSVLGLFALYLVGILAILVAEPVQTWHHHPILLSIGAIATAVGVAGWLTSRYARSSGASVSPSESSSEPAVAPAAKTGGWFDRIRVATVQALTAWRSIRARDWSVVGVFAIINWLTDMLCLVAAAKAFNLPVGLITIASVYLGVQIVRQIPLTPGGIGLVEAGLLAGLVSAGGPAAAAAAVVLTYRVLSCWVLLPLGGLAWLGLRTGNRATSA